MWFSMAAFDEGGTPVIKMTCELATSQIGSMQLFCCFKAASITGNILRRSKWSFRDFHWQYK